MSLESLQNYECRLLENPLHFATTMEEVENQKPLVQNVKELTLYGSMSERIQVIEQTEKTARYVLDHVLEIKGPSEAIQKRKLEELQQKSVVYLSISAIGLIATSASTYFFFAEKPLLSLLPSLIFITGSFLFAQNRNEIYQWKQDPKEIVANIRRKIYEHQSLHHDMIAKSTYSKQGVIHPAEIPENILLPKLKTFLLHLESFDATLVKDKARMVRSFFHQYQLSNQQDFLTYQGKTHPLKAYLQCITPDLAHIKQSFDKLDQNHRKIHEELLQLVSERKAIICKLEKDQLVHFEAHHQEKMKQLEVEKEKHLQPFAKLMQQRIDKIQNHKKDALIDFSQDPEMLHSNEFYQLRTQHLEKIANLEQVYTQQKESYLKEKQQNVIYEDLNNINFVPSAPPMEAQEVEDNIPSAPPMKEVEVEDNDHTLMLINKQKEQAFSRLYAYLNAEYIEVAKKLYDSSNERQNIVDYYQDKKKQFQTFFENGVKWNHENFTPKYDQLDSLKQKAEQNLISDANEGIAHFYDTVKEKIENLAYAVKCFDLQYDLPSFCELGPHMEKSMEPFFFPSSRYLHTLQPTDWIIQNAPSYNKQAWMKAMQSGFHDQNLLQEYFA